MAYVLGPKNFMRGERNDAARIQKLEKMVDALIKRVAELESAKESPWSDANDIAEAFARDTSVHIGSATTTKRGPGRPPKRHDVT